MARPKKTLSEAKENLPKNWYEQILTEYSEGASDVEIRAMLIGWLDSFSLDLWKRWIEEEEEFSLTIKKGKQLSEAWWVKSGRKNLQNKDFSATLFYMNMKNRFGWADKQINENKNESTLNVTVSKDLHSKLDDLIEG